jgi:hypothetical protein
MIVEFLLTLLEEAEHDAHLEACKDTACDHPAHLVQAVLDRCSGPAQAYVFVSESSARYAKSLRHNEERRDREDRQAASRKQEARSLTAIRRGWNRLYLAGGE